MAPRAKWTKEDVRPMAQFGAIFVVVGIGFGLLSGGGPLIGAVAGVLLFALVLGVGSLADYFSR